MNIKTQTGSIYQLDIDNKRVARLHGNTPPTARQGKDGEWATYVYVSTPTVGNGLLILWDSNGRCTMTSPVVSIHYDDEIGSGWSN